MSTAEDGSNKKIESLTEGNFSSWFVDIRAELRTKKLWKYTQGPYESDGNQAKWEEKAQEAADIMTPTVSSGVKQGLTEAEFNDGHLMLSRLRELMQPTGSSEFMRLSKEYYTLRFKSFKTVAEYLTHIKVLEERIDATKVVLDKDNRTVLCLSMSLPQEYQYLVQIWATMPTITSLKARQMVLEASRQHTQARSNGDSQESASEPSFKAAQAKAEEKCKHCKGRHPTDQCWTEYPEDAPQWFRDRMKEEAKEKGDKGRQARKFMARLARQDFGDSQGVHISV